MFVLFKAQRNLVSLCQMLYVHAHYLNKAHFASCDCSIKRIVDDLGSVVKLMLLHKGIRDAGLDNSEVTAGPPLPLPICLVIGLKWTR